MAGVYGPIRMFAPQHQRSKRSRENLSTESISIMPWQSLPPFVIMVGAIAAIGAGQYGVHYLYHGETKKVTRDRWDELQVWRDKNIASQKQARESADADAHH